MSRQKALTKYFVKSSLEEMFRNSKMKAPVVIILMLVLVGCLSAPLDILVLASYSPLKALNQEGMIVTTILNLSILISFFFGMYTIMNVFYFSNDIEYILPLPFKSKDIVLAKFVTVMANMLLYSAMLIVPLVTYGVISKASPIYYLYVVVVLLITPVFPMVIATAISILLMRFTNFSKHKDAFKVISGCLSLILIIGFNMISQNTGDKDVSKIVDELSQGNNSFIGKISGLFITNKFSTIGLINSENLKGLVNIILSIAISLLLLYLLYIIGGKFYLKSIVGISESYSKRENILKTKDQGKLIGNGSPIRALVMKEIKSIIRTPQLFINCIAMLLYMPVIIGIAMFSGGNISKVSEFVGAWEYSSPILVAVFIASSLMVSSGGAGITALSREGKDISISKYIPVDYRTLLNAKIISSLCINGIALLIIVLGLIIVKASLIVLLLGTIVAASSIGTVTIFSMLIDYRSPKLNWEDEKELLKNNYVPLLIMVIMLVIGGLLLLLSLFLFKNGIVMFLIIMMINVLFSYLIYKKLIVYAEKVYNEK